MAAHKVLPHARLEQLADGVWRVKGSLPYPLHRNMIVVRLASGELLLHSVVALDEAGFKELEALGPPTIAIVPNVLHLMDAPAYKARYPRLRLVAPAETKAAVADEIAIDANGRRPPAAAWLHPPCGSRDQGSRVCL